MLKSGLQSKEVVIPMPATVKGRKQGKLNKSKQLQVAFSLYTSIKMVTGDRQILALQLSFIYI